MQSIITELPLSVRAQQRGTILERIRCYIKERLYQHQLSPGEIQRTFELSRPTLYRMFEADGGLVEYIRKCRLQDAAAELIGSPNIAIIDVAYRTGFNSASDFSRAFRRAYGLTPREFRRQREMLSHSGT